MPAIELQAEDAEGNAVKLGVTEDGSAYIECSAPGRWDVQPKIFDILVKQAQVNIAVHVPPKPSPLAVAHIDPAQLERLRRQLPS